jgi:predicted nucleic acid-binding protein
MSKIFLDTNILVYSIDNSNLEKKNDARKILKHLVRNHQPVISTQVLQEFFVASTKKLKVDPLVSKSILQSFLNFEVITISPDLINKAIDCSILNTLSFLDSLIVASAEFSKCSEIYTEDLNNEQIIRGIKIKNPFL